MRTMVDMKEKLETYKWEILKYTNKKRKTSFLFENILLITVEENIALWKVENPFKGEAYVYTDLNGKLLFGEKTFFYATAFSNGRACINYLDQWYILDLGKEELISLPEGLYFENLNGFRNDQLVLFDGNKKGWGSYIYNSKENIFIPNLPFIWDALEISRKENQVYVGIAKNVLLSSFSNSNEKNFFDIPVFPLEIKDAYDSLIYYQMLEVKEKHSTKVQHLLKEISNQISIERKKQIVKRERMQEHFIADHYFKEWENSNLLKNDGSIIETEDLADYQKKIGKLY